MKLLIELPDGYVGVVMRNQRIDGSAMDKLLRQAVVDGTQLPDIFDLQGLKSDIKALNCGYPYGLDYLLNCLKKRLGITIIDIESEARK